VTLDYRGKRATYSTDELTLDEVEDIERVSGVAWALSNPLASIKQAKGYLVVFALRDGMTEDEIEEWFDGMKLGDIAGAFEYDDSDLLARFAEITAQSAPKGRSSKVSRDGKKPAKRAQVSTSRDGLDGPRPNTNGRPPKPAGKGSMT
jgi:hypothetical protein